MALNSNFRTLTADNIEGIVEDRNYLKSSFENGTITGWTEVAVALTSGLPTGTPTIGATAASSLALSATSVTPLSGSRSLLVDIPSALTAGHGFISDEFTLDRMDLGKVLTVSFDYERVTGTYNFSGTLGSQTWMVYIYDATAGGANWIQPAGFLGMNQSSGPGRVRATFQTSVTAGQKYRVAVIASQAASGASSIEFDNFTCSRQTAPIGPVVTDWVSYTPTFTGFGTPTNVSFFWRRSGDSLEINATFTTGTCTATEARISLPSGLTIDSSKISGNLVVGYGGLAGSPTPVNVLATGGHTYFRFGPNSNLSTTANNANSIFSNSTAVSFQAFAPISGWSSNVQLSNDTDTRVVAARYTTSTSRTLNNTAPVLLYETLDIDSHSGYNTSTGVYTVPVSGIYRVTGNLYVNAVATSSSFLTTLVLFKNGVSIANLGGTRAESSASSQKQNNGSTIAQFNAGDQITIRGYSDTPNTLVASQPQQNYFSIERLSGPSVVAASESVGCKATSSTTTVTTSGTTIIYSSKVFDTHNSYNPANGTYLVPISGTYAISASIHTANQTVATNTLAVALRSQRNNITQREWYAIGTGGASVNYSMSMYDEVFCNAGDTLSVQGQVATNGALTGSATLNVLTIRRVGN